MGRIPGEFFQETCPLLRTFSNMITIFLNLSVGDQKDDQRQNVTEDGFLSAFSPRPHSNDLLDSSWLWINEGSRGFVK